VAWRESDGTEHTTETRQLIITAPPWKWASLPLETTLTRVQQEGQRVEAPPLTLVVRGYDRKQVAHPLNGFGLLAPRLERRHVLGVLFPSSVFPDCAPEGKVLLSTFIGGTRAPEQAWLNDDATGKLVDQELGDLLGVQGPPERQWIMRWQQAIPQYHHGHGRFLEALAAAEQQHPGLHFVGNFRDGVSLMSTLRRGRELGRSLPLG
jgi:oxygen-dependent protoporphyrinogen oxidase